MSKGTKQIRLGRVTRFIEAMEVRLIALEGVYKLTPSPELKGQITELKFQIFELKEEFDLWEK